MGTDMFDFQAIMSVVYDVLTYKFFIFGSYVTLEGGVIFLEFVGLGFDALYKFYW